MINHPIEVRTKSVPTAASLLMLGHPCIGTYQDFSSGATVYRFSHEAEADLRRFIEAKQQIDQLAP